MTFDQSRVRAPVGLLLLVLLMISTLVLGGPGLGQDPPAHRAAAMRAASMEPVRARWHDAATTPTHCGRTVARLGGQRSLAWRRGDPALLDRVFVPGSEPWRQERRLMRAYAGRGLHVLGLSLIVDDVLVIASGAGWVRLSVIDTMHPSVAVGNDGRRHRLPRDSATRHVVTLERSAARWRISAVRLVTS